MTTIYRYNLTPALLGKECIIQVPYLPGTTKLKDQLCKVDIIRDIPSVWFMVDTESSLAVYSIAAYGTGWDMGTTIPQDYLGSIIFDDCGEIYHFCARRI